MALNINQNPKQEQTNVPPPPIPEVAVRTMQSDIRSISTGEARPTPEIVPTPNARQSVSQEPSFIPETNNKLGGAVAGVGTKKSKKALMGVIAVIILIALGAVGYYVVYPLITGGDAAPVTTQPPVQPVIADVPSGNAAPTTGTTSHLSLFTTQPTKTVVVALTDSLNQTAITEAIIANSDQLQNGDSAELVFTDGRSNQVSFSAFITALLPGYPDATKASGLFANDFTAFVYKNDKGVWPGYVAKINSNVVDADITAWLTGMEKAELSELFVTSPGTFAAFKSGTLNGIPDRYAVGANAGASLGYATANGQLIISTSYDGLKQAFKLLGL